MPMVKGIGIDIVEVKRIRDIFDRYGERFARRILTQGEHELFFKRNHSALYLSSRFAAKEAASKALGSGIAAGIGFHDIEVIKDSDGRPELVLSGAARARQDQLGVRRCLLSLSDEKHYAVAMVVLEGA